LHFLISDLNVNSPGELEDFINHSFPAGDEIDVDKANMVQKLIIHKFEWGIDEAKFRKWIIGGYLSYDVLGAVTMILMKFTSDGSFEDARACSHETDYYYVAQK